MFSKISKINLISAWPKNNILKGSTFTSGSGSSAKIYRYSSPFSSSSNYISSTIKNSAAPSTNNINDISSTIKSNNVSSASAHPADNVTAPNAQPSYYDNNKSKSFKKIFWGWIGLIVLSNISFYLVKNEIDSRRKANYLGMLEKEDDVEK